MVAKALKTSNDVLAVKVCTNQKYLQVSVQSLKSMKVLAAFKLHHPQEMVTDPPPYNNVNDLSQTTGQLTKAIACLNSKHIASEMVSIHQKWCEARQLTLNNEFAISPIEKCLTLHRRTFYDEKREVLIIATANCAVSNTAVQTDSLLLNDAVDALNLRLELPDRKQFTVTVKPLQECVAPGEMAQLNRRDIVRLKIVARKLLDEPAELKFDPEEEFPYSLP